MICQHWVVVAIAPVTSSSLRRIRRARHLKWVTRDLHGFITYLGLTNIVLAGWSMGAFVTWEYFRQFSSTNISGCVVIDESASDYKWSDWPYGFADFDQLCHIMSATQTERAAEVRELIPTMFKEPPSEKDVAWMFTEVTRLPESIASAILFNQTVQDYWPVLSNVTVPTLLCFGGDEKLIRRCCRCAFAATPAQCPLGDVRS